MTISYDVLPPFMKKESESLTFPKLSKNIDYGFISPWQVPFSLRYFKQDKMERKIFIS